jgi:hypothetical protein
MHAEAPHVPVGYYSFEIPTIGAVAAVSIAIAADGGMSDGQ